MTIDPNLDAKVSATRTWFRGRRFMLTGRMWRDRKHIERSITHLGGTIISDTRGLAPGTVTLVIGDTGRHGVTAKIADARARGVSEIPDSTLKDAIRVANTAPVVVNPGHTVQAKVDAVRLEIQRRADREVARAMRGSVGLDGNPIPSDNEPEIDRVALAEAEALLDLD